MEYLFLIIIVLFLFLILYTVCLVYILYGSNNFARKVYIRRKKEILCYAEFIELPISEDMMDFILEKPPCEINDLIALLAGYRDGTGEEPPTLEDLRILYQKYFENEVRP